MNNSQIHQNSQMHIAQLVETLEMGGAENLAVQIAGYFAAQGYQSHLIVTTGPGSLSERISPDVHVHYLNYQRASIKNPFSFLLSLNAGYKLLRTVIADNGIQLVQTHLPGSNFWGLVLALNNCCQVVATVHNNVEFRYSAEDLQHRVMLRKMAYKMIVRHCDCTIAVSQAVKDSLQIELGAGKKLAEKIAVVTNGVVVPEQLAAEQIYQIRDKWSVPSGVPFLLAAGRLDEQKNFKDLISVATILKSRSVEFHLIIAGEGVLRQDLEDQIAASSLSQQVQLPGVVAELQDLMLSADLLVFPSLWEGLPLVLLEGMAAGLPVVCNRIDGTAELVEDVVHGRIVEPHDIEGFAEAVASALADSASRNQWAATNRAMVEREYSFVKVGKNVEAVYNKLIGTDLN